jgi:signal transduction histidine kinase
MTRRPNDASLGLAESAAFAIMMALAAYLGRENPRFAHPQILWDFLGLLTFNLLNFSALPGRLAPLVRARVAAGVNTLLISLIILHSGGRESYFWVMLLLPLFSAALALPNAELAGELAVIAALLAAFYAPILRSRSWAEALELAVKIATLAAAAGMTRRVAAAERAARGQLEREQERALRERVEMREKLQHIDRLATLGTLSAGIAHELNGPLASILGFAEAGLEEAPEPEQAHVLEQVAKNAKRCRDIIQNTLSFARTRGGPREPADLNALVRQCVDLKRHDWHGGGVRIDEAYAPSLPLAPVSGAEIQQIVFNLLTNAEQSIRSGPAGAGVVRVGTRAEDGRVIITVEDDGPGIAPENLARIWEPFFTTKPAGQGTGLGLSISRRIAENHKGRLRVESKPGRTAFSLELPAAA